MLFIRMLSIDYLSVDCFSLAISGTGSFSCVLFYCTELLLTPDIIRYSIPKFITIRRILLSKALRGDTPASVIPLNGLLSMDTATDGIIHSEIFSWNNHKISLIGKLICRGWMRTLYINFKNLPLHQIVPNGNIKDTSIREGTPHKRGECINKTR